MQGQCLIPGLTYAVKPKALRLLECHFYDIFLLVIMGVMQAGVPHCAICWPDFS